MLLQRAHRANAIQNSDEGFTLIELMVVIALIGIMTALIIPEMKGTFQDALLRSSARRLIEVFNLANSRAVSLNQAQRVHLDRRNGHYSIDRLSVGQTTASTPEDIAGGQGAIDDRIALDLRKPRPEESEESQEHSPEDSSPSSLDSISFYADGTAEAAEILLRDKTGLHLTLRINPVTARVQIMETDDK